MPTLGIPTKRPPDGHPVAELYHRTAPSPERLSAAGGRARPRIWAARLTADTTRRPSPTYLYGADKIPEYRQSHRQLPNRTSQATALSLGLLAGALRRDDVWSPTLCFWRVNLL